MSVLGKSGHRHFENMRALTATGKQVFDQAGQDNRVCIDACAEFCEIVHSNPRADAPHRMTEAGGVRNLTGGGLAA